MKKKIVYIFSLGLVVTVYVFFNCNSGDRIKQVVVEENYKTYCSGCHGMQLQQFKILQSFTKSNRELSQAIKNGNTEKGMPPFGEMLSEDDVKKLVQYIKTYKYENDYVNVVTKKEKKYEVELVAKDLEIPWGMAFLPNGDMLITEKKGVFSRLTKAGVKQRIKGLPPINSEGQGGLLDVCLHPNYERNGWVYISYSYIDKKDAKLTNTAIIRAKIRKNTLTDIQTIYKGKPTVRTRHHYGNRMVFDNEGYLYFSNGDRGKRDIFPQRLDNTNGKIHRIYDDGSIPKSNPFYNKQGAIKSIYSYGHRNPQGLVKHPNTGQIWEHEHGPKGGDEINIIQSAKNYGWPVISYGINYDGTTFTDKTQKEGMQQPMYYYVPSIAPCGMVFLTSDVYPKWKHNLFIGSLKFRYLERLVISGDKVIYQEKILDEYHSRVRNVAMGRDGYLYVAMENPGRILKIIPKR